MIDNREDFLEQINSYTKLIDELESLRMYAKQIKDMQNLQVLYKRYGEYKKQLIIQQTF